MNSRKILVQRFIKIGEFLRVSDWYDSKVPFLMCFTLLSMLSAPAVSALVFPTQVLSTSERMARWFSSFMFYSFFLAFGYLINDYADRDVDQRAGKEKLIHGMKESRIFLTMGVVITASVLPVLLVSRLSPYVLVMAALTFVLGASYSLPPLRFKERGVLGLIVSSAAQRCMPVMVTAGLFHPRTSLILLFLSCSFLSGLRYILIHQVIDIENDRKADVHTFAEKNYAYCVRGIYAVFLLEIVSMALLLFMIRRPVIWLSVLPAVLLDSTACMAVRNCMMKPVFTTFYCVPGEAFYNIYLPLILTVLSVREMPDMFIIVICTCIYLFKPFRKRMNLAHRFIRNRTGNRTMKSRRT